MTAQKGVDTDKAAPHVWASALVEICDVLRALFERRGRATEQAGEEARAAVIELAQHFGGRDFYLPRGDRLLCALRDIEIHRRATGSNAKALATEYGVSDRRIREIVRVQHDLAQAKRRKTLESAT